MIQYFEKRGDKRIEYKIPVSVEDIEDGFIYRARMVNYNKSGMYLETDVILDSGAEIYIGMEDSPFILSSSTSTSIPSQYFRAKIKWLKESKDNLFNFGYGVAILSAEDVMNIIRYTADDVNSVTNPGRDDFIGYGRINMERALVPIILSALNKKK